MTGPKRVDALVAAADTLRLLNVEQDRPIDPFAAIDALGLDLVIAKLDNLLGAVLPHGNGGVLVTSQRPIGVQRYTAAHEIGHWVMHSAELRLDDANDVLGTPSTELERQAQLFAAYFLMPPPVMEAAVTRYGLIRGRVRPEQVYLVSRDVDVSYEAAIRRLATMDVIDSADISAFLKIGRLNALKGAFDGHRPVDGNAEMWSVDATLDQVDLPVREGDDVLIMLPENRTTGWRWLDTAALQRRSTAAPGRRPTAPHLHDVLGNDQLKAPATPPVAIHDPHDSGAVASARDGDAQDLGDAPLFVVGDAYYLRGDGRTGQQLERRRRRLAGTGSAGGGELASDNASEVLVGATGQRTMAVHCAEPGEWTFDLHYTHAYDPSAPSAAQYQLRVQVDPTPSHAYRMRRLAADLDTRLPGDPADEAVFEVLP